MGRQRVCLRHCPVPHGEGSVPLISDATAGGTSETARAHAGRAGPAGRLLLAGAGALSGLLFAISFPPADLGAVGFVAFVPLLLVLHRARGCGGAALAGAAAGAAACLPAFAWVASVAV
ncbi:hypothetical protein, partial [Hydrogenophaga sp.]|uniref:hypothetical protein n=1 Tax=Hydrogenophaga sp. TaxID=1904254 RepID=UPI0034382B95